MTDFPWYPQIDGCRGCGATESVDCTCTAPGMTTTHNPEENVMPQNTAVDEKPAGVEATQFKNGDHPEDRVGKMERDELTGERYERLEGAVVRYFRHPDVSGDRQCVSSHC